MVSIQGREGQTGQIHAPVLFARKGGTQMVDQMIPYQERMVHVRFEGQSWDIAFRVLDIGDLSSDRDVRQALARYLDAPADRFARYVVERHANGNITVRPEAVFG
jgi:hypothetical protein